MRKRKPKFSDQDYSNASAENIQFEKDLCQYYEALEENKQFDKGLEDYLQIYELPWSEGTIAILKFKDWKPRGSPDPKPIKCHD